MPVFQVVIIDLPVHKDLAYGILQRQAPGVPPHRIIRISSSQIPAHGIPCGLAVFQSPSNVFGIEPGKPIAPVYTERNIILELQPAAVCQDFFLMFQEFLYPSPAGLTDKIPIYPITLRILIRSY